MSERGGAAWSDPSNEATGPALGDPEPLLEDDDGPPTAIRGYQFPRFNSFKMSMWSAWSATIFLRRVFSFSSS